MIDYKYTKNVGNMFSFLSEHLIFFLMFFDQFDQWDTYPNFHCNKVDCTLTNNYIIILVIKL